MANLNIQESEPGLLWLWNPFHDIEWDAAIPDSNVYLIFPNFFTLDMHGSIIYDTDVAYSRESIWLARF